MDEIESWPCDSSEYSLEHLIGRGSFAKVYTATCAKKRSDGVQRVALKVMDLEHINTEIADISKEVQMMRMCHHSNVLCCHASFVSKSELFLVTPLMEKGSCLRIMRVAKRQGRGEGLAEQWLGYVLFEILSGLGYLHDNGHIHRDIKAGNILLDPNGKAALSDFGVSSWLVHAGLRRRTAKTFVGTPCWMAPEVMEQVEGYDYKADIWSFGITALELAKGFAPYALHPPMKVLLLTIQEEPPSLRSYATEKSCTGESFSRSFKEMVRMCLQKEARKRPTVQTLMNCKFFKTKWPVGPLVNELLCHIPDDPKSSQASSLYLTTDGYNENDTVIFNEDASCPGKTLRQGSSEAEAMALANKTPLQGESGEFVRGTTWTFEDGHGIVLKSESHIRQEIDAKCAQDDQECAAIFDDLEDLMNQRGGEWDFKKNHDVQRCSSPSPSQRFGSG